MGRLVPGSRPYHDLPNVPSLTSGGLGRLLGKHLKHPQDNSAKAKVEFLTHIRIKESIHLRTLYKVFSVPSAPDDALNRDYAKIVSAYGVKIIPKEQIWHDLAEAMKKDMHPEGFKRVK
ncbi:hypothetical protein QJS10_CPA03g01914 [Acorus calamus]|uniref:Uncharacterized protein n=1 Tax=Acorus calamus TaxID=4465 RepID=A0AAV9F6T7_ACOCL|nr:hypothetical protein QJS10_CPA03g01914 [Acorus calamus]